jgi:hypothetical protein
LQLLASENSADSRSLFLFIQEDEENLLLEARSISQRNTSTFHPPVDSKAKLPEPNGKPVKSRIEYIIHQPCNAAG